MNPDSPGVEANRLHGSNDEHGSKRWCRGCGEWVLLLDWHDHRYHYPTALEDCE